jgi:hypothetical protein
MTIQTAIAIPAKNVRSLDTNVYDVVVKASLPATTNGDSQVILTLPHAARLIGAFLRVPATLGANAVCKLQKRDAVTTTAVDITSATTAATAGVEDGTGLLPIDVKGGDTIELLVSGANASAGSIEIDLLLQRA